jgi:hypothetical protein
MVRLIDIFKTLHSGRKQDRLAAMHRLISAFHNQSRQRWGKNQAAFNIFSLVDFGTDEVRHSAFLAWLLDPDAGHGQGNVFLKAFLDACRPSVPLAIPDEYHVQTEFSGSLSRVDILVHQAKEFLLYIENKTVSDATPGQHDREFDDLRRVGSSMLAVPEGAQFAIYLTPEGRTASGRHAHHWHRVAYRDIGKSFENLLPDITSDKVRHVLADWLDTILTFTGTWRQAMAGFSDESVLIAENWETALNIIRARERLDQELTEILFSVEEDLRQLDWWDQGWQFKTLGNQIYIINKNWLNAKGDQMLWMGVYEFDAAHVFGLKSPPLFYVRTWKEYGDLHQILMKNAKAAGYAVTEGKWYFIGRDIQKCATGSQAVKEYPGAVRKQIVDLFTEYATLMMQLEQIIRQYLKDLETTM